MINNIVKAAEFDAWIGAPSLFTIGKTELVNIYVRNKGNTDDSYNVTNYTKIATRNSQDVSHLVIVSIQSYRIKALKTNETGDTFAKIILLGPIDSGSITFNITSDSDNDYRLVTISLTTGSAIVLSEFGFSGLIEILLLTVFILVVSYTSHLS